jgi:hypothetical protein
VRPSPLGRRNSPSLHVRLVAAAQQQAIVRGLRVKVCAGMPSTGRDKDGYTAACVCGFRSSLVVCRRWASTLAASATA